MQPMAASPGCPVDVKRAFVALTPMARSLSTATTTRMTAISNASCPYAGRCWNENCHTVPGVGTIHDYSHANGCHVGC